jgi:hypothetical protein
MPFPDQDYLENLIDHLTRKTRQTNKPEDLLLMLSGASLNWIADFVLDESVVWEKREIKVADLYLTGTNPEWNKVIIDKAQRSPEKLQQIMAEIPSVKGLFADCVFDNVPILVRVDGGKLKVLDGIHRLIAAIRDDRKTVIGYVGTKTGDSRPLCEAHVVYDFIRAYQRSAVKDREGLIAALKFLKNNYVNVEGLLRNRFNADWVPDEDVQKIIAEVLK